MSPTQPPPALPSDAIEATEYKIQDKVYFLYSKIWRKGEVKNYEGSSNESPRYLVNHSSLTVKLAQTDAETGRQIEDEATKQEHKMASSQIRKREDGQVSSQQT
ncbi:MAG: hypothetical protein LQ346_004306 [Caloplaca aetnensis]|nr:MAG: hypothetical protein LQ346_004306 [Caloplaca aetnensis]